MKEFFKKIRKFIGWGGQNESQGSAEVTSKRSNKEMMTELYAAIRGNEKTKIVDLINEGIKIDTKSQIVQDQLRISESGMQTGEIKDFVIAQYHAKHHLISDATKEHAGGIKGALVQGASKLKRAVISILPGKQKTTNRENMDGRF